MQGRSARRASVIAVLEVRRDVQCNDRERDIGERHSGKKDEGIRGTRHLGVGGPDPHCAARLTTPNVDRPRAGAGVALAGIAVSPNTGRSRDSRSSPRRRHRDSFSCPGWLRSGVRAAAHPRQSLPGAAAPGCGPLGSIEHGSIPLRLPVTALSANARVGDRGQCLTAGMDDFSTSSAWRSSSTTYRRADCPKHRPGGFPREPGDADLGRNSAQSDSRLESKRRARSAGRDRNPFPRCGAAAFGALSRTVPSFEADALHRAGRIAGLLLALISSQEG